MSLQSNSFKGTLGSKIWNGLPLSALLPHSWANMLSRIYIVKKKKKTTLVEASTLFYPIFLLNISPLTPFLHMLPFCSNGDSHSCWHLGICRAHYEGTHTAETLSWRIKTSDPPLVDIKGISRARFLRLCHTVHFSYFSRRGLLEVLTWTVIKEREH